MKSIDAGKSRFDITALDDDNEDYINDTKTAHMIKATHQLYLNIKGEYSNQSHRPTDDNNHHDASGMDDADADEEDDDDDDDGQQDNANQKSITKINNNHNKLNVPSTCHPHPHHHHSHSHHAHHHHPLAPFMPHNDNDVNVDEDDISHSLRMPLSNYAMDIADVNGITCSSTTNLLNYDAKACLLDWNALFNKMRNTWEEPNALQMIANDVNATNMITTQCDMLLQNDSINNSMQQYRYQHDKNSNV